MKHLKPFLIGFVVVLVLDAAWWFIYRNLPAVSGTGGVVLVGLPQPWSSAVTDNPALVYPWYAIGLFVALAGWTRRSSTGARLMVALGAVVGTAAALATFATVTFYSFGAA